MSERGGSRGRSNSDGWKEEEDRKDTQKRGGGVKLNKGRHTGHKRVMRE